MMTTRSRGRPKYSAASAVMPEVPTNRRVHGQFGTLFGGQPQGVGNVGGLHVPVAGGDVDDAVVDVAEIVDLDPLRGRGVRDLERLEMIPNTLLVDAVTGCGSSGLKIVWMV
jgi:hypothetical protein